ncbi:MAG: hypothetical protein ABIQ27_05310 [Flavobacterium sp.]|uniref:hypothetical protein n=1 Tax=Flavobacterium sp. TaxID=239 RepID=UPI00326607C0
MKKTILIFIVFVSNLVIGQRLPILKLTNPINTKYVIKSPLELKKDEICVTLIQGGGMSGYDYYTHYIFTNNQEVTVFKEEIPKQYLKNKNLKRTSKKIDIDKESKLKFLSILNSKANLEFINFSQKDFFKPKKTKTIQPPCMDDAPGYSISYIQNNKQNLYSFYAPEYYYQNKCKNENINRPVLEKFVKLLELWEVIPN